MLKPTIGACTTDRAAPPPDSIGADDDDPHPDAGSVGCAPLGLPLLALHHAHHREKQQHHRTDKDQEPKQRLCRSERRAGGHQGRTHRNEGHEVAIVVFRRHRSVETQVRRDSQFRASPRPRPASRAMSTGSSMRPPEPAWCRKLLEFGVFVRPSAFTVRAKHEPDFMLKTGVSHGNLQASEAVHADPEPPRAATSAPAGAGPLRTVCARSGRR
jgi:hypothetical protein